MASDPHYIMVFTGFFIFLAVLSPLLNDEFNASLDESSHGEIISEDEVEDANILTAGSIILNLILIPFWTFGLPVWFNLTFLLLIRIVFVFVVIRNIIP